MIFRQLSELIADGEVGRDVLGVSAQKDGGGGVARRIAHKTGIADFCQSDGYVIADDDVADRQVHAAIRASIPTVERRIVHLAVFLVVGT